MQKSKQLGQVYTPAWIVKYILDGLNYAGVEIVKKSVLEPACGDGAFLLEIVRRYILAARELHLSDDEIIADLECYIYAVDIDETAYHQCLLNLNQLCAEMFQRNVEIRWQVFHQDTLSFYTNYTAFFDYIIGNPPYIRIHHLPEQTRTFIKQQFRFTKGTTDLYLVFFEMAFKMIKPTGKIGFITPNSFLYNASYLAFRTQLTCDQTLFELVDFQSYKVFESFSTYTAISLFDFSKKTEQFNYNEYHQGEFKQVNQVNFKQLEAKKWVLSSRDDEQFLTTLFAEKKQTLEDYFHIQYGFATLRDRIFISRISELDEHYVLFNGAKIEKGILYQVVKGSKYRGDLNDTEWIIFPYIKQNGKYICYTEQDLKTKYPFAYQYLLENKIELLSRDLDKNSPWFAFGRSQGVQSSHNEKIVLSTLVYDKVHFYHLPDNIFVYSGIFITKKDPNVSWDRLQEILASNEFYQYVRLTGKDFSGGYKSLSSKQIKHFKFNDNETKETEQLTLF